MRVVVLLRFEGERSVLGSSKWLLTLRFARIWVFFDVLFLKSFILFWFWLFWSMTKSLKCLDSSCDDDFVVCIWIQLAL